MLHDGAVMRGIICVRDCERSVKHSAVIPRNRVRRVAQDEKGKLEGNHLCLMVTSRAGLVRSCPFLSIDRAHLCVVRCGIVCSLDA